MYKNTSGNFIIYFLLSDRRGTPTKNVLFCHPSLSVFDAGLALSYGSHLESTIEHHKQAKDDRPENQNWVVHHISQPLNNLSNSLF